MTNPESPETTALPLEELELTPQWVKAPAQDFTHHRGDGEGAPRPKGRDREFRRDKPRGDRPPKPGGRRPERRGPEQSRPSPSAPPPPAPVDVTFLPEEHSFAAMVETMKHSPRAYPLFDVAKLILNKPERHQVKLARKPGADGTRAPLCCVLASGDIFLDQEEACRFVFGRRVDLVAAEIRTQIDPPKGNFAFVNRCGLTGVWLGPPNYHEYQARVVRHHQQRLRHIPFEQFKMRIQTVKDPEAVKAWMDGMSVKLEYECRLCGTAATVPTVEPVAAGDQPPGTTATTPAAPVAAPRFGNREELEKHVREKHLEALFSASTEVILPGVASRQVQHHTIMPAIRQAWETEMRFPIKTVNELRPQLQRAGFHFFKHPNGVTYISRIKTKRFEAGQDLTERVRRILELIRADKKCTRVKLLGLVAPPSADGKPAADQDAWLTDLHWLIGDGYVVELGDGKLWAPPEKILPPPAPPTPEPQPAESKTDPAATAETTSPATAPPAESESPTA